MPYRGKPSKGCANCRKRKIGCSQERPACSQCIKSGWKCPGYRNQADISFLDETETVKRKFSIRTRNGESPQSESSELIILESPPKINFASPPTQPAQPSLTDRAVAFFFQRYVYRPTSYQVTGTELARSPTGADHGHHEYFPDLFLQSSRDGPLACIVEAAGLASLANAGNTSQWMKLAFIAYGRALSAIRKSLMDPALVKKDETLAAIIMMGVFEVRRTLLDCLQSAKSCD